MTELAATILRMKCDVQTARTTALSDKATSASPRLWRGAAAKIQIGIFSGSSVLDLNNIDYLTLEIRDQTQRTAPSYVSKTVDSEDFGSLSAETWAADSAQHAEFELSNDDLDLELGSTDKDFWLIVYAVTADATPKEIPVGYTTLKILESGAGEDTPSGSSYYTDEQCDARFAQKTPTNGSYRIKDGQHFQLYNQTQAKWHTLFVTGAAGAEQLSIGPGED